jgi:diguanylate cyclase (GGDEF)-like protein
LSDKFKELGIPEYEITPAVSIAVSALVNRIDQLETELGQVRGSLESLQSMVDIEGEITLPNRRAFLSRLNWSIAMFKRYGGKTSALVFRINDYEGITRVYGLQAAIRVAKLVAEYLSTNIRDTDYFARLSKDEFGVLMYFAEYDDVIRKADNLIVKLRTMPMRWNNTVINIGLSVGVHLIDKSDTPDAALIATANASHIYEQKKKFEEINFKA